MNKSKIISLPTNLSVLKTKNKESHQISETHITTVYKLLYYQHKSIPIFDNKKINIVPISSIVYIQSQSSYSTIFMKNGTKLITSKTLKHWQQKIDDIHFIKCHSSYLVNSKYISSIELGGNILTINNISLPIARSRKNHILKYFS